MSVFYLYGIARSVICSLKAEPCMMKAIKSTLANIPRDSSTWITTWDLRVQAAERIANVLTALTYSDSTVCMYPRDRK